MSTAAESKYLVAIVGAGPAGIYAAREMAAKGARVVMFNRDIRPGGLAEYGIYLEKHKMKTGLRKQFQKILADPEITYVGNITIGAEGDLTLDDLFDLGFQAALVTVGAQGTKWIGVTGTEHVGAYHAKDIVYYYNGLPPFSEQEFQIGKRAALIGVGNVMADIARWLTRVRGVDEVIAVARRGPAEVKFTPKEFHTFSKNVGIEDFEAEFARCTPLMEELGQDVAAAKEYLEKGIEKGGEPTSQTRVRFDFLASPKTILADDDGNVRGLEIEDNTMILKDGVTKARGTGIMRTLDVDTVIFCIGDTVDKSFGLPAEDWGEFVKAPEPRFPVDEFSYEAFDPEKGEILERVFLAGWARSASNGVVGAARKDGANGSEALHAYLEQIGPASSLDLGALNERLAGIDKRFVNVDDYLELRAVEEREAEEVGNPEFRYRTNEDMLAAIDAGN